MADPASDLPSGPQLLALASGDGQVGLVGRMMNDHLVVQVTDASGRGLGGVIVEWTALDGAGVICTDETACDSADHPQANGRALEVTDGLGFSHVRYAPSRLGWNFITASAPVLRGSPVAFTATGVATRISLYRMCESSEVGAAFEDQNGSNVSRVALNSVVLWEFTPSSDCTARIVSTFVPSGGTPFDSGGLLGYTYFTAILDRTGTWEYQDEESGARGVLIVEEDE